MSVESVFPTLVDIPSVMHKEEDLFLVSLPFVIDPPRSPTRLRGERFEHIFVKPDPEDNISYKWRVIGKIIKWIWHVLIEETVRVIVEKGINEGLDGITKGEDPEDPDKPEETEKENPPEPEKEEEVSEEPEPEWI